MKTGKSKLPAQLYYNGVSMDAIWGVRSLGIDPENGKEIYLTKDGLAYLYLEFRGPGGFRRQTA